MDKQEKILTQGIKFIVRDNSSKNEFEEGFTNHVPFILDVNEIQIRLFRESIQAENDHGADLEIIREDTGFITSKNRFVDPIEAVDIANNAHQIKEFARLYGEYFKINDTGSHKDAKNAFKKYMDRVDEKRADGLKPEDLY